MKLKMVRVPFGSDRWDELLKLRDDVLRKPLGMVFTSQQLAEEKDQWHLGFFDGTDKLTGVIVLVPLGETIKMRQVAVQPALQNKGLGTEMLLRSEALARHKGFAKMWCHAREEAVPFYLKQGYKIIGERFIEVSIPHYKMEKSL